MMNDWRCHSARVAWRCNVALFVRAMAGYLVGLLLLAGTAGLFVRMWSPEHIVWLWVAAGVVPVLIIWCHLRLREQYFDEQHALVWLDRQTHAGGLLLTTAEIDDGAWEGQLETIAVRAAAPRYLWYRPLQRLVAPALFVAAALLVPIPERATADSDRSDLAAAHAAEELAETIEAWQEEGLIDEETAEELKDELETIAHEDGASDPAQEWEALDAISEQLEDQAQQASDALAWAARAVDALQSAGGDAETENLKGAENELMKALEAMQKQGMLKDMPPALGVPFGNNQDGRMGGMPNLPDDPEARKRLLEALKKYVAKRHEMMSKMGQCKGGCCNGEGMGEKLALSDGWDPTEKEGEKDGKPGRGGLSRGRGDAPMIFGDESQENGAKFEEKALPPGKWLDPSKTELIGITKIAPEKSEAGSSAQGAKREHSATRGGMTWKRKIRPRHRGPVQRYFSNKSGSTSADGETP